MQTNTSHQARAAPYAEVRFLIVVLANSQVHGNKLYFMKHSPVVELGQFYNITIKNGFAKIIEQLYSFNTSAAYRRRQNML